MMTTDETKCKKFGCRKKQERKLVAFNYRHSVHATQLKELLAAKGLGK
ncbi:MAG: hypothetical protein IPM85_02775 [Chitinophagaceae bacterium]|nr:hypothetical protein [Chitinophagaceae bacterium]